MGSDGNIMNSGSERSRHSRKNGWVNAGAPVGLPQGFKILNPCGTRGGTMASKNIFFVFFVTPSCALWLNNGLRLK